MPGAPTEVVPATRAGPARPAAEPGAATVGGGRFHLPRSRRPPPAVAASTAKPGRPTSRGGGFHPARWPACTSELDVSTSEVKAPALDPAVRNTEVRNGFEASKRQDSPDAPGNLRLRHGKMPGTVDGTVDPIPGGNIRTYEGQSAPDSDGPWSEIQSFPNTRAIHFAGLERGKDTWFRVRARNVIGAGGATRPSSW